MKLGCSRSRFGPLGRSASIGIDDGSTRREPEVVSDPPPPPPAAAARFAALFPEIYLHFHRRDEKRSELSGASRAVLSHLALSGPLTIGEAAGHLRRAQSVVSEIVTQLAGKGLLERWRDPRDRRRTLVWLTPAGIELLERDRDVLSIDLLTAAFARMSPGEQQALSVGVAALLRCAPSPAPASAPAPASGTTHRPDPTTPEGPPP